MPPRVNAGLRLSPSQQAGRASQAERADGARPGRARLSGSPERLARALVPEALGVPEALVPEALVPERWSRRAGHRGRAVVLDRGGAGRTAEADVVGRASARRAPSPG